MHAQQAAQQALRSVMRSDSDESIDLAAMIYELELATAAAAAEADAHTQRAAQAAPENTPLLENTAQALETIAERARRLEMLQVRMRLLFGNEALGESDAITSNPELPSPPSSSAPTNSSNRRRDVPSSSTNPQGTPSRRIEVRQARNSPGSRVSYSIDPEYNIDSSDDDSSSDDTNIARLAGDNAADAAQQGGETGNDSEANRTREALRSLLRFGSPDEINQIAEALPTTAVQAGSTPSARHSSAGNTGGNSASSNRQQLRLARMTQRAEEEAQLNRAILMSIQETNATADRRSRESTAAAGANVADGTAASAEPAEGDVAMLVSMGFTREQSVQALLENRLNVELAANRLLGIDF